MANHLTHAHPKLTSMQRKKALFTAKVVSSTYVQPSRGQKTLRQCIINKKPVYQPQADPVRSNSFSGLRGATRGMGKHPLECAEIKEFIAYLQTIDGHMKTAHVARQIGTDVSKILYYCNPTRVDWMVLLCRENVLSCMEHLRLLGLGPDGQLTRVQRLCDALRFIEYKKYGDVSGMYRTLDNWKTTLAKKRQKLTVKRLDALSDVSNDVREVGKLLLGNSKMIERYDKTINKLRKGASLEERDLKYCTAALMLVLMYSNWQRPGTVSNCTIQEFEECVFINDKYVIKVHEHKTAQMGSAKLCLSPTNYKRAQAYFDYVRPKLALAGKDVPNFFILLNSTPVTKISNLMRFLERELQIDKLPSATDVRKAGATQAAKSCSESDARLIHRQLSHDPAVAAKYYEAIRGAEGCSEAYETISRIMSSPSEAGPSSRGDDAGPSTTTTKDVSRN